MGMRSNDLIDLAKKFIRRTFTDKCYISVSGSAARGTADRYSDIDLTIYDDDNRLIDTNSEFHGRIVQVQTARFPQIEQVYKHPWAHRFLSEIVIMKDQRSRLEKTKNHAVAFFQSPDGRQQMIYEVQKTVEERISAAHQHVAVGRFYSATHAAMGAWSEAAFLHMYLTENALSTGGVIPCIRKNQRWFDLFKKYSPICPCNILTDFTPILHKLRNYLRKQYRDELFDLDPLQDKLVAYKNRRFMQIGDMLNLQWQMYGEALWLYFCTEADHKTFEEFYRSLPDELKRECRLIGFVPLEKQSIDGLCDLSRMMIRFNRKGL